MPALLPTTLLTLILLLIAPTLSTASPSPPLLASDYAISLVPRHTLFLRQLTDLQTFSSALGGAKASSITNSGDKARPFSVGGDTFDSFASAAQRSCDEQFTACGDLANGAGGQARKQEQRQGKSRSGSGNGNGNGSRRKGKDKRQEGGSGRLSVKACDEQKSEFRPRI